LNPRIELDLWACRVEGSCLEAFCEGCVVVTEAVDDAATKAEIVKWFIERSPGSWLVTASGLGGIGPANEIRTVALADHIVACGDFSTPSDNSFGVCAPRVMLTASHQALAILRILAGLDPA
jgi:sulfur carrier protein ThiS adenylyltransferase